MSFVATMRSRLHGDGETYNWNIISAFLVPALAVYAVFTLYPIAQTVYNSFYTIATNQPATFVGWSNYTSILWSDAVFWQSMRNTAIWAIVAPVIDVTLGLVLATLLYAKIPFTRFFRVAWFTPVLISYVVVGIIWLWIYNYDWGVINNILRALGLDGLAMVWLGNPSTALLSLIVVDGWKWVGFHMVVCLAALSSLPREVIEAAELDNCGWIQKLWFVMIPMIKPTLINLAILSFIGKMKVFDLVWIMTKGGPLWATETISTYVYKRAFEWNTFDLGYPSAIAVTAFVMVFAFVLIVSALLRDRQKLEY